MESLVTFKGHIAEPCEKSPSDLLRYLISAFHSDNNNMHSHHQSIMFLFPNIKASTFYNFCLFLWVVCGFLLLVFLFLILIIVTKVKLAHKRVWICILMAKDRKHFKNFLQLFNFIVHNFVLFLILTDESIIKIYWIFTSSYYAYIKNIKFEVLILMFSGFSSFCVIDKNPLSEV